MARNSLSLAIVAALSAAGCVADGPKRDQQAPGPGLATMSPADQSRLSPQNDDWRDASNNLWRDSYEFGDPNPQRIRSGQEPKDF